MADGEGGMKSEARSSNLAKPEPRPSRSFQTRNPKAEGRKKAEVRNAKPESEKRTTAGARQEVDARKLKPFCVRFGKDEAKFEGRSDEGRNEDEEDSEPREAGRVRMNDEWRMAREE